MSQRPSGYARRPDEQYETVEWPILALLAARQIPPGGRVWDPCDRGCGQLVATLRAQGLDAIGTSADFFTITTAPAGVTDLITNPPYGENGRGELAVKFIEHALDLRIPRVAMLLASTSTAQSRGNICSDITQASPARSCSSTGSSGSRGHRHRPTITGGSCGTARTSARPQSNTSRARRRNHADLHRVVISQSATSVGVHRSRRGGVHDARLANGRRHAREVVRGILRRPGGLRRRPQRRR